MKTTELSPVRWLMVLAVALILGTSMTVGVGTAAEEESSPIEGLTRAEALALGERMYREGILPSGEPMRAFVQGDIEVDGTMFSCQSCHVRSGMGSTEGTVITYPTCGSWLYKPLQGAEMKPESQARVPARLDPPPFRPAYTDESLARAIRRGKDPNDRVLNYVMPRYLVGGTDLDILVYYLKNLSSQWSPGVDDTTIRFATVIGPDVDEVDRQAMLGPLEAHVRDHNSQTRHDERRARGGPFYKEEKFAPYRRYSLSVWELDGSPESWPEQLEAFYRNEPVFALLGGITTGEWAPIHEFCEQNQIPSLLPVTDFPVISDSDWYTLYFSKGYFKEGETAARFIRRSDEIADGAPVVQVFREQPASREMSRGFASARATMGLPPATEVVLDSKSAPGAEVWKKLAASHPGAVFSLWLDAADLSAVTELGSSDAAPSAIFVSSTLVGEDLYSLPEAVRRITWITHPRSFVEDEKRSRLATESWLRAKKLDVTNFEIQAKMYFLGWTLAPMVKMMRDDFYRDYFFDIVDMMRDQYYSIAVYPRLSFGPGQRYASKGCYIVRLSDGDEPTLEKVSDWGVLGGTRGRATVDRSPRRGVGVGECRWGVGGGGAVEG